MQFITDSYWPFSVIMDKTANRRSLVCAATLLLMACTTTSTHQLKHTAKDPEWTVEPFKKILVVGLQEVVSTYVDLVVEELSNNKLIRSCL